MAADKKHIRHIMLYEFRKNNNASVATKNNDIQLKIDTNFIF